MAVLFGFRLTTGTSLLLRALRCAEWVMAGGGLEVVFDGVDCGEAGGADELFALH